MAQAVVTEQAIDVSVLEAMVTGPQYGAVVSFVGAVRDRDHGRPVINLRYEAHPTATRVISELAAEVLSRHPGVSLAAAHRSGDLTVGDAAFVVAAAAVHRTEAFDACRDLVDTVKDNLPIWKLQHFSDGTHEWVNCA